VNLHDPAAAAAVRDYRWLAVYGYVLEVPGSNLSVADAQRSFGVRVLDKTTDARGLACTRTMPPESAVVFRCASAFKRRAVFRALAPMYRGLWPMRSQTPIRACVPRI